MSSPSRRWLGLFSGLLCLILGLFLYYWPDWPHWLPHQPSFPSGPAQPPPAQLPVPGDNRNFLPWFESSFFGFPEEGGEKGRSERYGIAVNTQVLPDGKLNLFVREGEGRSRLTTKEYDLQFLSPSGKAETLHLALFTYLSDWDNLNRLMTEKLRFRPAQKRSRSNAFAFTYQNRQYTLIGNAIISIRDTGPGTAILTLQLWESLIHPQE